MNRKRSNTLKKLESRNGLADCGGSYYGLNDFELRWIGDSNWTYTSGPIEGL